MAHPVRLRRDEFEREAMKRGLDSQSAQARALDVATSIHHRALLGKRDLSGLYVLRVLMLVGDAQTRRQVTKLFDIPAETARQAGAA